MYMKLSEQACPNMEVKNLVITSPMLVIKFTSDLKWHTDLVALPEVYRWSSYDVSMDD